MEFKRIAQNQTLADFVLQHCGTLQCAMKVIFDNNRSLTDAIEVDNILMVDTDNDAIDKVVVDYFKENNIVPATKADL